MCLLLATLQLGTGQILNLGKHTEGKAIGKSMGTSYDRTDVTRGTNSTGLCVSLCKPSMGGTEQSYAFGDASVEMGF